MDSIEKAIEKLGLPGRDPADNPSSQKRFPDGGQYRLEIPSTEGPEVLRVVLEEADKRSIPVHRISQGTGIMLMTDDEISQMCILGRERQIEINLFVGPRATFDTGAQAFSPAGKTLGLSLRGADQLRFALLDIQRAADLGLRSVLISDIGILQTISKMRRAGDLPKDLIIKTSVMMAPSNPASARVLEDLGADTINVPSDLSLAHLAGIRAAIDATIDFYIEAPDNIGGFIRYYELPEMIRIASPLYVKFGLRNSPDVYPSGSHLDSTVISLSRERLRRAQIAMEMLKRHAPELVMSPLRSADLGIPAEAHVPVS